MHDRPIARAAILIIPPPADLVTQVGRALAEDIGPRDLSAELIPTGRRVRARVITREAAVICGRPWVDETFRQVDATSRPADVLTRMDWNVREGQQATADTVLFEASGNARTLLTAERTALNFLQLLSATATEANRYAQCVAGTECKILDTRKTIPGLRTAQKYAVRIGGGHNHRIGLYDGILIKENHILAAGSIAAAVAAARRQSAEVPVEVEVESLDELRETIAAKADSALLDEFSLEDLQIAVEINRGAGRLLKLEASGGVTLANVRAIAQTGVDFVSIGSITKHVRAVDLSMRFVFESLGGSTSMSTEA